MWTRDGKKWSQKALGFKMKLKFTGSAIKEWKKLLRLHKINQSKSACLF